MVRKRLVQQAVGAAALGAVVLGASGFSAARQAPQAAPATHTFATTAHVLNYPNIDSGLFPKTFDPANVTDSQSIQVLPMLYGNLVKLTTNNVIIPDLATWTIGGGGKVYTFKIRGDARFSDGSPVTANDALYSLDRALNPHVFNGKASPVAGLYLGHIVGAAAYNGKGDVAGLKRIDEHTLQITLDSPISFFLQTLSYPTADVVKKGTPINGLTTSNPEQNQISSGPFKISGYRFKSLLSFTPNPYWYGAKAMKLTRVDMPFIPTFDTSYSDYESGQYSMGNVPPSRLVIARSKPDFHEIPILGIDYISFNFNKAPFSNKNLRLAMSYAIDRDTINNVVLHGGQTTIYSLVPKGIPGYDAAGQGKVPYYNVTLAKQYLAKAKQQMGASFPTGPIVIKYQNSGPDLTREYIVLQSEWKAIGLNVQPQNLDFNSWLNLVQKPTGNESWVENAWIDDYPDAQDFTTNLLTPSSGYNIGNYNNPQFNSLTNQALTAKGNERAQLYVQASRVALNDVAWAMIGQNVYAWRWVSNIKGMTMWSGEIYPVPVNNDWTQVDVQ